MGVAKTRRGSKYSSIRLGNIMNLFKMYRDIFLIVSHIELNLSYQNIKI